MFRFTAVFDRRILLPLLIAAALLAAIQGCSDRDRPGSEETVGEVAPGAIGESGSRDLASASADSRPSIILVVIDTLRADAVSAYGHVEGTTPTIDHLASAGIRYENAYSPSPWTAPSHATLFTGLNVREHGVGVGQKLEVSESLTTIAERLQRAGYQTAGFSENLLVSEKWGFAQGFDQFEWLKLSDLLADKKKGLRRTASFDVVSRIRNWLTKIEPNEPYFLFVNIYDTHSPYEVEDDSSFLPVEVDSKTARRIVDLYPVGSSHCARLPAKEALAILKGLYLDGVRRADEKLEEILSIIGTDTSTRPPITVVTSDHGESLGEHRFSVRNTTLPF